MNEFALFAAKKCLLCESTNCNIRELEIAICEFCMNDRRKLKKINLFGL